MTLTLYIILKYSLYCFNGSMLGGRYMEGDLCLHKINAFLIHPNPLLSTKLPLLKAHTIPLPLSFLHLSSQIWAEYTTFII